MRLAPPYDKAEKTWATIAGAQILGVMYDPKRKVVYAGSRTTKMLYKIDATDPSKVTPMVAVEMGYNGITLADDGAIFYTDQTSGMVFRVTPDGMKTTVTKTKVNQADGLAFGPDGQLYIIPFANPCPITRLKLQNNVEVSRDVYVTLMSGSGDGIAFDKAGNMYVTAGGLFKVAVADKKVTMLSGNGGANVEFGVGALSCKEILWASTPPKHLAGDTEGADVYWHRP